ncbi:hypothetical protein T11_17447 [Trichinella zimbabwensis]|uniref:Uncharacterized protein n=1 Tax=Trichinella zimbabwensis TaxID=268475 RepID=A0A0V1HQN9_9BILA|nr:hypothetical protein T11_17447 [Trichinella zimbabwensis]
MSSRVGLLRSVLEILYKVMEGCDRQQIVVEWHHSRFQTVKTFPSGSFQSDASYFEIGEKNLYRLSTAEN